MKHSQSGPNDENIALTQGLSDFSDLLVGLTPRSGSRRAPARMRPANVPRMRDNDENITDNNPDGDSHEEGDDLWVTSRDADEEFNTGRAQNEDHPDKDDRNKGYPQSSLVPSVEKFELTRSGPLVAVDAGLIRLAETAEGLIIAIRAAIVVEYPTAAAEKSQVFLLRSGPLLLPWSHQLEVLHAVGKVMGDPSLFVTMDESDSSNPQPLELKRGSDRPDLYSHRVMVLWERLAQQMAVELAPKNGILLLDGALTLRSRDTPQRFLKEMVKKASNKGVSVVALSKQSKLLVGPTLDSVKAIQFWLDDEPHRVCYRLLSPMLNAVTARAGANGKQSQQQRADRILGRCYAIRLSPLGETYRFDLHAAPGNMDSEVMNQFKSSTMIVAGYPSVLAQAHAHGYFSTADVLTLQVQAMGMFGLHPQTALSYTGAFAPFQGGFK